MKLKIKILISMIVMLLIVSHSCLAAEKNAAPAVPIAPVVPIAPAVPIAPVVPIAPAVPIAPVVPIAPAVPIAPVVPIAPAAPAAPVVPTAPTTQVAPAVRSVGYIFIGDSRMKGIDVFGGLSASNDIWVLSDVSRNYKYLTAQAEADILALEAANPQINIWYEIYALGLNDIGNKDKYCQWYQNRAMAHNVIVVSVDPIDYHKSITNDMISVFNESLALSGLKYIDSNRYLMNNGFATSDGVHFKNDTSKKLAVYLAGRVRNIAH